MDIGSIFTTLMQESGFAALGHPGGWQQGVMVLLSFILMYMAIVKKFEPLLLLPIAFGIFLSNLPAAERATMAAVRAQPTHMNTSTMRARMTMAR